MTRRQPDAVDPDTILRELLAECRDGVRTCFQISLDEEYGGGTRMEAMKTAAHLTKASLALAAALNKTSADFTHRIIVQRADPSPPPKISDKTIPGVSAQAEPED
ncbi:MAG TPA: hypothetical protein VNH44_07575 [Micropepsaceae bacterium]|nr:hypothetical protein [Micropepsaceae bacterium]